MKACIEIYDTRTQKVLIKDYNQKTALIKLIKKVGIINIYSLLMNDGTDLMINNEVDLLLSNEYAFTTTHQLVNYIEKRF